MREKPPRDREAFVAEHLSFVRGVAARVREQLPKSIEFDELVGYGVQGLLEAADRFDGEQGARFTTFAYYRVRGAIYDGLRRMGWLPRAEYARTRVDERVGAYLASRSDRAEDERASSAAGPGGTIEEDVRELAEALGGIAAIFVTTLTVQDAEALLDEAPAAPDRLERREASDALREAIEALPAKERRLLELYYFEEKTLEEAGALMGLSKSWSSRLHARAIDLLQVELGHALPPATGPRQRARR